MVKPITPKQVKQKRKQIIPNEVIESINELLVTGSISSDIHGEQGILVLQKDIVSLVLTKTNNEVTEFKLLENNWLDIDEIFAKYGWNVIRDRDHPISFIFKVENDYSGYDRDY